jgi:hypothetical protein
MGHLLPIQVSSGPLQRNNLQARLRAETACNAVKARPEVRYFKQYYLLVEETSGLYRPLLISEYPQPASNEEGTWPQLFFGEPGRSPFIRASRTTTDSRRTVHGAATPAGAAPATGTVAAATAHKTAVQPATPTETPSALTKTCVSAMPHSLKTVERMGCGMITPGTMGKPTLTRPTELTSASLYGNTTVPPPSLSPLMRRAVSGLTEEATKRSPVEEVSAASGMHLSTATTAAAMSASSMVTPTGTMVPGSSQRQLELLGRRVLGRVDNETQIGQPTGRSNITKTSASNRTGNLEKPAPEGTPVLSPAARRRPGYCEHCRVKYVDIVQASGS